MSQPVEIAMEQMITSYAISRCIYVAAKLGISDILASGSVNISEIASKTNTNSGTLYRILRTLASVGIYEETTTENFVLTPLAELLKTDVPNSLNAMALMWGESWHLLPWANLMSSVKTGKSSFEDVWKKPVFTYFQENPEANTIFNDTMTNFSTLVKDDIAKSYDFSGVNTLVDVAGGHGILLATILKLNPHLQGILFDLPHVLPGAKSMLAKEGVSDRCELVSGDFFTSVPKGADCYIMKHIIHDWNDESCIKILSNCCQAMSDNGKVLLVEGVIFPGNDPSTAKIIDLEMLVMTDGGKERTENEYKTLLNSAGLELTKIYFVPETWYNIIEAKPL